MAKRPTAPAITSSTRSIFNTGSTLLPEMLSMAVPLRVHDYKQRGGPGEADFARAASFATELGERGDVLLFGGRKGEAADMFNKTADAIAILSFVPGGVKLFGQHWESK